MADFAINNDFSIDVYVRGSLVLQNPLLNKGTAFSDEERTRLKLHGLLPPHIKTLDEQITHCYTEYQKKTTNLAKHIYLRGLQDRNELLFYALLRQHIEEMLEIIYTPVVGEACRHFYDIYRRPRGLFISYPNRDRIDEMLGNCALPKVKAIVVTDGGRILGLGDQGAGGMGISIGKTSLYTACGGLHPAFGLPVMLDVGTNNEAMLADPNYLGWRHERLTGDAYYDFIDQFVQAVKRRFPHSIVQWEDFPKQHAQKILDRYRDQLLSFNDDIQGTAAVTLAAILAGIRVAKRELREERVVIVGAGSSGMGIARLLIRAMERAGLSQEEAARRIWILNSHGVLSSENPGSDPLFHKERAFSLFDCINVAMPTVLIGVSAQKGIFSEQIITTMARQCERPIILPLSNPDSLSEAEPKDLIDWTEGRALIATGTKFPDYIYKGRNYSHGQNNNHYIFPAIALGVLASGASYISNDMFLAAAQRLADHSPMLKDPQAPLFPKASELPQIARSVAVAVAQHAGVLEHEAEVRIAHAFWEPSYPLYISK